MRVVASVCLVIVAGLIVACGGVDNPRPLPKITVGPRLAATGATFGEWERKNGDFLTVLSLPLTAEKSIERDSITVKCKGVGGLVVEDGWSDHPTIKPGQKAKVKVISLDEADLAEIVLDLPD